MNEKRHRKKPVGKSGFLWLDPKNRDAKYNSIRYGQTKREIENYIFRVALATAAKQGLNIYDLVEKPSNSNAENGFDLTLHTKWGEEHLDLMEVAPLEETRGSYMDAAGSYNNGEMAALVWNKVAPKSKRYGSRRRERIHLLLYSTDWGFKLSGEVLGLLALEAAQKG